MSSQYADTLVATMSSEDKQVLVTKDIVRTIEQKQTVFKSDECQCQMNPSTII